MSNPIYQQLAPKGGNNLLQRITEFKKMINGNPQQIVQNMVNSGRISHEQVNQLAQQANQIYSQFKNLI